MLAVMVLLGFATSSANPPVDVSVSFGVFYSSLGPQGEWLYVDNGVYAWRPLHVAAGWRPYMYGHWVWTDDGWFWASDEEWGWATYHYGRWYYDDFYGWVWIPGYEWAPAWVEWRYGGPYVGWAPLSPYAVFSVDYGIYYRRTWVTPYDYWVFMDCHYINSPDVHRYVYRTDNNARFIETTRTGGSVRVVGGRIVSRGPDRGYVERRGSVRIQRADIVTTDRPQERIVRSGERQSVEVYRPRLEPAAQGGEVVRPEHVRETGRALSLDTRQIDVSSRVQERSSVGRREEAVQARPPAEVQRKQNPARSGEVISRDPASVERDARVRPRTEEQRSAPQNQVARPKAEKPRMERRVEQSRPQPEQVRPAAPGRTMRHAEPRPAPRPAPPNRGERRR